MPNTTALALQSKATACPLIIYSQPDMTSQPKNQLNVLTVPDSIVLKAKSGNSPSLSQVDQMPFVMVEDLSPQTNQDVFEFQNKADLGSKSQGSKKRWSASKQGLTSLQRAILKAHQQTLAALSALQNQAQERLSPVIEDFDLMGNPDPLSLFAFTDGQDGAHRSFFVPLPLGLMMPPALPFGSPASSGFEQTLRNQEQRAERVAPFQTQDEKRAPGISQTISSTVNKPSRLKKAMAALALAGLGSLTIFTLVKTPRKELGSIFLNASTFAVTENLMENAFRILV